MYVSVCWVHQFPYQKILGWAQESSSSSSLEGGTPLSCWYTSRQSCMPVGIWFPNVGSSYQNFLGSSSSSLEGGTRRDNPDLGAAPCDYPPTYSAFNNSMYLSVSIFYTLEEEYTILVYFTLPIASSRILLGAYQICYAMCIHEQYSPCIWEKQQVLLKVEEISYAVVQYSVTVLVQWYSKTVAIFSLHMRSNPCAQG